MKFESEWLFGFATSIQERISTLQPCTCTNGLDSLSKWRARKTLLTDGDFETMLKYNKLSSQAFNFGINALTEGSLKVLFKFVREQDWYKLHKSVFSSQVNFKAADLETALRFHVQHYLNHVKKYISKFDDIKIDDNCLEFMKDCLMSELLNIAHRTLVWDVHDVIDREGIEEPDSEKVYLKYLETRFGTSESCELFFLEYPTLARLLSERLMYAKENFEHVINALVDASAELSNVFGLTLPFLIHKWDWQKGDSHNRGKTTTFLELNEVPLVYKYHNNDALIAFNSFLSCVEKINAQCQFYKISCVTGKDYCFEEYIENDSCTSTAQIEKYYRNYGVLVAITYWLGSTDMHMENLITKGEYPVLIDVETLIRPEDCRIYSDDFTKNKFFEQDSVVTTSLLPMTKYWKRQIDFSALNGQKQKLPFKVRKLVNENSGDIMYQLEEEYLHTAQNVPLLNGKAIPFNNYTSLILGSYKEMIDSLIKNQRELSSIVNRLFDHTQQRVLLRDTQDYQNFLSFSTHPSCMVDYIEREKIFENLWSNSFTNQEVIIHEAVSLMSHDIPYFYTYTDSKDLFDPDNAICGYYQKSMLDIFHEHILGLSRQKIDFSIHLLEESLDTLNAEHRLIEIPNMNEHIGNKYLRKTADIADLILQKIYIDKEHKAILWAEIINTDEKLCS